MTLPDEKRGTTTSDDALAARTLFARWMATWNQRRASEFATLFTGDGRSVGFDGSQLDGRAQIESQIGQIFADHQTGRYVGLVREVRALVPGVALLCGVVGMVPYGQTELNPALNAIVALVATQQAEGWRIALLQNTQAQFHGRPEMAAALTAELRQLV